MNGDDHVEGTDAAGFRRWISPGAALFVLAFALRLLFLFATPDAGWPSSAWYKGDAFVWTEYAEALEAGRPFELGLPLRPPGMAYLTAALRSALPTVGLKILWCALGAWIPWWVYRTTRRSLGEGTARLAGLLCATSSGLMILSTSLNNETPYLVVIAASVAAWNRWRERPGGLAAATWGGLGALGCLLRVEHLLFFLVSSAALAWLGRTRETAPSWRLRGFAAAAFALLLAPWQIHAFRAIEAFNEREPASDPAYEAAQSRVETMLAGLPWAEEARARAEEIPACCRRAATNFVAATVAVRNGERVEPGDWQVLEEAFGAVPEKVSTPFVALYGPLNFYLANNPRARGGFSRGPLDEPPPLRGGAQRYPTALLAGMPPPALALAYPPHLRLVNDGYRLGLRWIAGNPGRFLRLAGRKLDLAVRGLGTGFTGWNLPLGLSGTRRTVDLVTAEGGFAAGWRWGLLVAAAAGLWLARRERALLPWWIFAGSVAVVTVAFFGYARHGAMMIPAASVGWAVLVERGWNRFGRPGSGRTGPRSTAVAVALLVGLILLEGARTASRPTVSVGGVTITESGDPFPQDHQVRRVRVGGS